MGQVKAHTRKTKSGKTVKVAAHERRGVRVATPGNPKVAEKMLKKRSRANISARNAWKHYGDGSDINELPTSKKRYLLKKMEEGGLHKMGHKKSWHSYHKDSKGKEYTIF